MFKEKMDDLSKEELDLIVETLSSEVIDLEYTSVSHENDLTLKVLQSAIEKLEKRIAELEKSELSK
jgi:hypothetical protein